MGCKGLHPSRPATVSRRRLRGVRFTSRGLSVFDLQIRQDIVENLFLLMGKIATGFLPDHFQVIDEKFGGFEMDLRLPGLRIGQLSQEERSLAGLHHDKLDEALGRFA